MNRWRSWPHGRGAARGWAHDYGVVLWGGGPGTLGRRDRGAGGLAPSALRWPVPALTVGLPSVGVLGHAAPFGLPTSHCIPS